MLVKNSIKSKRISSFMESIKDKSSLKILVVMILSYICCVYFDTVSESYHISFKQSEVS